MSIFITISSQQSLNGKLVLYTTVRAILLQEQCMIVTNHEMFIVSAQNGPDPYPTLSYHALIIMIYVVRGKLIISVVKL